MPWIRHFALFSTLLQCVIGSLAVAVPSVATAGEAYWVTSENLNRRTCPSAKCGIVGKYQFREAADVEEIQDGWARVSKYYNASCVNGRSEYVDSGNSDCIEANGITNGNFAEWVAVEHLSKTRPADPAAGATGIAALIRGSDDFGRHQTAFVKATRALLVDGRCTEADFREIGGWMRSTNHAEKPIYFTYCGGMKQVNKIYLDASSGRIFK